MRLGPVTLTWGAAVSPNGSRPAARPDTGEIGATGTAIVGGQITESDYNELLTGTSALETYDKMRRGDGTVAGVLAACSFPIRAAEWAITPASDEEADKEVAEFVEQNLFGMTITWDDVLRQALLKHAFGFFPFEKVWRIAEGRVWLRKLAPRLPKTITGWKFDEEGGLAGVEQQAMQQGMIKTVDIPVEKLLVFTHDREGSDYRGMSILRPAVKHWWYKDRLYRIDAIAAERHGAGIPRAQAKEEGATTEEAARAETVLRTLHAHQKAYLVNPSHRWEFDILDMKATSLKNIMGSSVAHHDLLIARAALAEFLNLGAGDTGSWALSEDKTTFFLMALRASANNIADTFNRYLIPQMVDYNFAGVKVYPKLGYSQLESRNAQGVADAVAKLLQTGGITADRDLEQAIRASLDLPPAPEAPSTAPAAPKEGEETERRPMLAFVARTAIERLADFATMERTLDAALDRLARVMGDIQRRQAERLVDLAFPLVQRQEMDRIAALDVPFKAELAPAALPILEELFRQGSDEVIKELRKQGANLEADPIPEQSLTRIRAFWGARLAQASRTAAARLAGALLGEALGQVRTGTADRAALSAAMLGLSVGTIRRIARELTNEAFGLGRANRAAKSDIERAVYSAIMDRATCGECAAIDRREFAVGSAEYAQHEPPYRRCLGHGSCRCVYIYLMKRG